MTPAIVTTLTSTASCSVSRYRLHARKVHSYLLIFETGGYRR